MFIIMGSSGDYSDRVVFIKGYTYDEDKAKEIVERLVQEDQLNASIRNAKSELRSSFLEEWQKENPYPVDPSENLKPIFDQARHKDKEYVEEHVKRKRIYEKARKDFEIGPFRDYYAARDKAANIYVEENFTMELCKPPEWTDNQYWYEKAEELI